METVKKLGREEIGKVLDGERFEMSGYDNAYDGRNRNHGERGSCVAHNTELLLRFAKFGIFEHTEYLYVDFYKGSPRIFFKYWNEDLVQEYAIPDSDLFIKGGLCNEYLEGYTTRQIIERVLELTIYSGKPTRRTQA